MMKKIKLLLFICSISLLTTAQDATIPDISYWGAPQIDGWEDMYSGREYNINVPVAQEEATLDLATWQAAVDDTALYVFIKIMDDNWCPSWCSNASDDQSDKPEIYLDVNVGELCDGMGTDSPEDISKGHYCIDPGPTEGVLHMINGHGVGEKNIHFTYGYDIREPNETWEYAIPFRYLIDKDGNTLDLCESYVIGFDVCFIDRDEGDTTGKRVCWKNDGSADGSTVNKYNMDAAGEILLEKRHECKVIIPYIDENIKTENITIYPNSTNGLIKISFGDNINNDLSIDIYTITGQLVYKLSENKTFINNEITINLTSFESGLYLIKIKIGSETFIEKIYKQ